ncbi:MULTISPECIES: alpha/beta hydrolase [Pseudoalteromonas]|uniref:4,5:9,10-diseco-3-hydroxy-5,9, 17-trioxoandrosta-1(10),2-diene-4-oate hydrolase n=2 Tax=Pseudoalteromonas nigrifaciens TaxID=28109 RepID=A0AAC9XWF7_9GAMM|nr:MULTISPECIES: alpha/beta hydrolase [Pseudoalteromonas]ASM53296.1 4,5:9,10-diseco-3-hydroxy-5,9,17-trioxoandrosta-1(10),2-diene-4-oate hydrolase [Pseudoalteromonas nigrifaciens]WMS95343.1 alpha/beta hydrolase [Pseudoalteromonas sp. HL-AS2]GEN40959.1 2-hydroxy-6-oxononadienedioate/2-hydroxy-6-oxononatrienedioate hydrolase [Pseudoalteromonas nigrifaciens]SUC52843.1 2-hydroxy-6-oxo-6-phenylhexa-2,4-dienoate hydrolase [Pseudoalteromonas nigrifaciens]
MNQQTTNPEKAQDLPLPLGHFVTLENGLKLHYLEQGQGPIVIWLHGSGPGASGFSNFKGNYPEFADAGYRNIVLDLPGFGRSDKPDDVNYDLAFFVTALNGFINALDLPKVTLLGNSLGGAIALGQALDYPDTVERLILMAPGGVEERETYFQMEGIVRMVEVYSRGPMGVDQMREVMSLQLFDSAVLSDDILAERAAVAVTQPANLFSTMMVPNMTERLGELNCPVLGFWGTNDKFNPHQGMHKILDNVPTARFIMLNRCGHWVQVEHQRLFNSSCIDFLQHG